LVNAAKKSFEAGDLQWALELSSGVLALTDPGDEDYETAKNIKVDCLRELGNSDANGIAKSYYLTSAEEVLGLEIERSPATMGNGTLIIDIDQLMEPFKYLLNAEICDENDEWTVAFSFTDIGRRFSYKLRRCVFEYRTDSDHVIPLVAHADPDLTLHMPSTVWRQILIKQMGFLEAYMGGLLLPQGDFSKVNEFMRLVLA